MEKVYCIEYTDFYDGKSTQCPGVGLGDIYTSPTDARDMAEKDYPLFFGDLHPLESHHAIIRTGFVDEFVGFCDTGIPTVIEIQPGYMELKTLDDCVARLETYMQWLIEQDSEE